jgi:rhodanese-related sulfurtransferase
MARFQKGTLVLAAVVSIFVIAAVALYKYAVDSPWRVSSEVAKQKIAAHEIDVVLDVRTDFERETLGFLPNSVHIQSADLEKEMGRLYPDKKTRILAYCNTGHRARLATDKLHVLGYKNAVYITGGYKTLQ